MSIGDKHILVAGKGEWTIMGGYSIFDGTIADMTWPAVQEAAGRNAVLLVPIAVIEQHGPHLPLATDTYGAFLLCSKVRTELIRANVATVMAPPYYFGMNPTTGMFPGSLHISRPTMLAVLTELFLNYGQWGFKRQFILNHHGDPTHNDTIMEAIRIVRDEGIDAVYTMGGFARQFIEEAYTAAFHKPLPLPRSALVQADESEATARVRERVTKSDLHVHAEEFETSMIMRWYPEVLDRSVDLSGLRPVLPTPEQFGEAIQQGKWRELSPLGYIGDPSVSTRENGELYALAAADIASAIVEFLGRKA
ncbi:MAG: creatininase family protein [bacterium]